MNIKINGKETAVLPNSTVAAALLSSGNTTFRKSVQNESRAPLCGMGICYECRVKIDGIDYERSCMVLCQEGMEVETP